VDRAAGPAGVLFRRGGRPLDMLCAVLKGRTFVIDMLPLLAQVLRPMHVQSCLTTCTRRAAACYEFASIEQVISQFCGTRALSR
jgi:hypothetical protein